MTYVHFSKPFLKNNPIQNNENVINCWDDKCIVRWNQYFKCCYTEYTHTRHMHFFKETKGTFFLFSLEVEWCSNFNSDQYIYAKFIISQQVNAIPFIQTECLHWTNFQLILFSTLTHTMNWSSSKTGWENSAQVNSHINDPEI